MSLGLKEVSDSLDADVGISVIDDSVDALTAQENPATQNIMASKAVFLSEEFENGGSPPTGWDYSDWTGYQWTLTTENTRYGAICGPGDYATACDSDAAGSGVPVDSWIKSPVINCAAASNTWLSFWHRYNWYGETSSEGIFVYVATDGNVGTGDTQIYHEYTADISLEQVQLDISSIVDGQSNVQIGFRYVGNYDYWWVIDSVLVNELSAPPVSSVNTIDPYLQTNPATITATANDPDGTVTSVDLWYRYSGTNVSFGAWTSYGTDSSAPWSWSFGFPDSSGYYEFYSISHDNDGMNEAAPGSADAICALSPPPTFWTETFDPTSGWTLTTTGRAWEETVESARYGEICGPGDNAWVCDSDRAGSGVNVDSWLKSPIIDCTNREWIELVFDHQYNWYSEGATEGAFIYVANDGSVDTGDPLVFHEYTGDIALETRRVNISAAADKSNIQIGFRYVGNYDYWWVVDDLLLQGYIADQLAPAQVDTLGGVAGDCSVDLDWSGYDEVGQGDVEGYRVYHDLVPITDVSALTPVGTTLAGDFTHTVTQLRNGVDHYFAVTAIDEVPNENPSVIDVGPLVPLPCNTVDIPLDTGWNLVSFPVIQEDTDINAVLSSIAGDWDYALYYDAATDTWQSHATFKPAFLNDLNDLNHIEAFWVHVNSPCTLTVQGAVAGNVDMDLEIGWNFLGYPTFATGTTIQDALAGVSYDIVEGFSITDPYNIEVLPNDYVMQNGEGYWVHCTAASTWTLNNDVVAPIVDSTFPADSATGVSVNAAVDITFSEEMDRAMAEAAFSINPSVPGSFSWNGPGTVMTFTPSSALTGGPTTYTVGVDFLACDMSQNGMPWSESFGFTTEDITPPNILSTDPFDGQTEVPPGQNLVVTFDEAMNQAQTQTAFSLVPPASGTFSWSPDGTTMSFNPDSTLALLTAYTFTVSTGARDLAGNNLVSACVVDFTTSADPVEKFAIIVGISDYQAISDLSYCDEDAWDCYYYLLAQGYTCEVYGDGHTANYPIYTGDADEATVRAAMQSMSATLTSNDYFVYTTSGHGDGNGAGSSNLCQWDEGVGGGGEDGTYWDTELAADMSPCVAEVQFVFIDHCYSGGMGPELIANPNGAQVYVGTTCTEDGYGWDDAAHSNGMWTYWFWEAGWDGQYGENPATSMETVWAWASANYPYQPPNGDAPMEFDGDPGSDTLI